MLLHDTDTDRDEAKCPGDTHIAQIGHTEIAMEHFLGSRLECKFISVFAQNCMQKVKISRWRTTNLRPMKLLLFHYFLYIY